MHATTTFIYALVAAGSALAVPITTNGRLTVVDPALRPILPRADEFGVMERLQRLKEAGGPILPRSRGFDAEGNPIVLESNTASVDNLEDFPTVTDDSDSVDNLEEFPTVVDDSSEEATSPSVSILPAQPSISGLPSNSGSPIIPILPVRERSRSFGRRRFSARTPADEFGVMERLQRLKEAGGPILPRSRGFTVNGKPIIVNRAPADEFNVMNMHKLNDLIHSTRANNFLSRQEEAAAPAEEAAPVEGEAAPAAAEGEAAAPEEFDIGKLLSGDLDIGSLLSNLDIGGLLGDIDLSSIVGTVGDVLSGEGGDVLSKIGEGVGDVVSSLTGGGDDEAAAPAEEAAPAEAKAEAAPAQAEAAPAQASEAASARDISKMEGLAALMGATA